MKRKSEILLPKTIEEIPNGGVYLQFVNCGKKTCKCTTSGELHPAFYFLIRLNGKQRKKHIRKEDVMTIVSLVKSARQTRSELRSERLEAIRTLRAIREFIVHAEEAKD